MHQALILAAHAGDEVHLERCFLRFDDDGAEAERHLHEAVLRFVDVLDHPEVDRLLLIGDEERLLW